MQVGSTRTAFSPGVWPVAGMSLVDRTSPQVAQAVVNVPSFVQVAALVTVGSPGV